MIKSIFSIAAFLLSTFSVFAQNNAIFFSEKGEKFQVVVNSIPQNDKPASAIKVEDLSASSTHLVSVIFEDRRLGEVSQNIRFQEEYIELTYNIHRRNNDPNGEYIIEFYSKTQLNSPSSPQTYAPSQSEPTSQNPQNMDPAKFQEQMNLFTQFMDVFKGMMSYFGFDDIKEEFEEEKKNFEEEVKKDAEETEKEIEEFYNYAPKEIQELRRGN